MQGGSNRLALMLAAQVTVSLAEPLIIEGP
jgi:hypothetical protein